MRPSLIFLFLSKSHPEVFRRKTKGRRLFPGDGLLGCGASL
jgi:hypothetical protein